MVLRAERWGKDYFQATEPETTRSLAWTDERTAKRSLRSMLGVVADHLKWL